MAKNIFDAPLVQGNLPLQPPPPAIEANEFKKVVESRRSIRVFTKDRIPEAITRECLRLALLAPNSSNLQPWEFYWVRSPIKKTALATACFSQPAAATAAELIVCVARHRTWKKRRDEMVERLSLQPNVPPAVLDYYRKLVPLAYTQGPLNLFGLVKKCLFFSIGFFKVVPREPTSTSEMKIWAVKSTALACENLMLAFRAHGFDTCPMEGFDSTKVKRLLKLPCDSTLVMVVGAGVRAPQGVYGEQIRFDSKLFIHEV